MGIVEFSQVDPAWLVINLVVLLFSLSVHESAHAWAANRLGDPTARDLGRITLNPIVHMDLIGTVLFPLLGLLVGGVVFGWAKPVPVNPNNLRRANQDHALVAAAGPASNVLAAVGFLLASKLLGTLFPAQIAAQQVVLFPLYLLFRVGLILNVILAVFNLFPIPPLDGSWILSRLFPGQVGSLIERARPYGFLLLILLIWSGVFSSVIGPILVFVQGLA